MDFLERFFGIRMAFWDWDPKWSYFKGSESWRKLIKSKFPWFLDFDGSFWVVGTFFGFWFKKKIFGIRMVTFWGVRKLKNINWRPLSLINLLCYHQTDKVGSRDASASKNLENYVFDCIGWRGPAWAEFFWSLTIHLLLYCVVLHCCVQGITIQIVITCNKLSRPMMIDWDQFRLADKRKSIDLQMAYAAYFQGIAAICEMFGFFLEFLVNASKCLLIFFQILVILLIFCHFSFFIPICRYNTHKIHLTWK